MQTGRRTISRRTRRLGKRGRAVIHVAVLMVKVLGRGDVLIVGARVSDRLADDFADSLDDVCLVADTWRVQTRCLWTPT